MHEPGFADAKHNKSSLKTAFVSCCHLSTIHNGSFTLYLLMLNVKQGSREYRPQKLWFDTSGNRTSAYTVLVKDAHSSQSLIAKFSLVLNFDSTPFVWVWRQIQIYVSTLQSILLLLKMFKNNRYIHNKAWQCKDNTNIENKHALAQKHSQKKKKTLSLSCYVYKKATGRRKQTANKLTANIMVRLR